MVVLSQCPREDAYISDNVFTLYNIIKYPSPFVVNYELHTALKMLQSKHNYVTVLPRSIAPPVLSPTSPIAKILVCPDFPPLKIPRYTAKLSYRHPPQVFRHKSRKTNLNIPVSTAHNYLLTAVY